MKFEPKVRSALSRLLETEDSKVIVDSTRVLTGEDDSVVIVNYHLEGKLNIPVQFTFPFVESVPLDESIAAFLDYGARNWEIADFAPGQFNSRSAGAD